MPITISDEAADFAQAVAAVAAGHWGSPHDAGTADLNVLWTEAVSQGWFELGEAGAFGAAVAATERLGRLACPLPVMDAYVATRLLADGGAKAAAEAIASGQIRVVAAAVPGHRHGAGSASATASVNSAGGASGTGGLGTGGSGTGGSGTGSLGTGGTGDDAGAGGSVLPYTECAQAATHVLTIPADGGTARLCPMRARRPQPGMARPEWHEVALGDPVAEVAVSAAAADEAMAALRLGLATRALAAAERSHEMAVEHAKVRVQFGKVIGSFGAVQQRAAACQIDVSGAGLLITEALRAQESGDPSWPLAAELAVTFAAMAAPRVQLGAHHTLAATGYFEEHDAPWLFRRVHADITRLQLYRRAGGDLADQLIGTGAALPAVHRDESGEAFRAELRAFLAQHAAQARRDSTDSFGQATYDGEEIIAAIAGRGWWGFGWPEEAGGRNASLAEQIVLAEELEYGRVPATIALGAVMLLGNSILKHGSPAQRAEFLPLIRAGKLRFCLGYSEPEAGSDLASLKTRAVRDGDGWAINGQKLWTTGGDVATHVWLATRTDPDASPPHAGITVFLIPMDTSGITVQPHIALSGGVSCTVFYDEVRVPDTARVGEVNGGWKVITDALAGERVLMGGIAAAIHRQFDDLLALVRTDPGTVAGPSGSAKRARISALAATLQATRALVASAIGATSGAAGAGARLEAPMAAVLGGELAEDFGEATLEILGPAAALSADNEGVPGDGAFEQGLRLSIMYVVGGGTNDIQRGLIARALGLPR